MPVTNEQAARIWLTDRRDKLIAETATMKTTLQQLEDWLTRPREELEAEHAALQSSVRLMDGRVLEIDNLIGELGTSVVGVPVPTEKPISSYKRGPNVNKGGDPAARLGPNGRQAKIIMTVLKEAGEQGVTPRQGTRIVRQRGFAIANSSFSARVSILHKIGKLNRIPCKDGKGYRYILKSEAHREVAQ